MLHGAVSWSKKTAFFFWFRFLDDFPEHKKTKKKNKKKHVLEKNVGPGPGPGGFLLGPLNQFLFKAIAKMLPEGAFTIRTYKVL